MIVWQRGFDSPDGSKTAPHMALFAELLAALTLVQGWGYP